MYGRFKVTVRPSKEKGSITSFNLSRVGENQDSLWDDWSAINYMPENRPPFVTKLSSLIGGNWREHWMEDHPNAFHTFEITWKPGFMEYRINGSRRRFVMGGKVAGLDKP